jgi:hypothetical protein
MPTLPVVKATRQLQLQQVLLINHHRNPRALDKTAKPQAGYCSAGPHHLVNDNHSALQYTAYILAMNRYNVHTHGAWQYCNAQTAVSKHTQSPPHLHFEMCLALPAIGTSCQMPVNSLAQYTHRKTKQQSAFAIERKYAVPVWCCQCQWHTLLMGSQ